MIFKYDRSGMNKYAKIGYLLRCARVARQLSTVSNKKPNFYELLGVSVKASAAEIKNAYFEKTKLYHPDVVSSTEESLSLFRQISEAYEVLGSPKLRKEYDRDVLGIWEEEDQDLEDTISSYKRKIAEERTYSWTKEHYNMLRKQQYTYNTPLHKHTEVKRKKVPENKNLVYGFTVFISVMLIMAVQMNAFDYVKEIL